MVNRPNFPGMNPYLENSAIWPEVHYGLLGALMRFLNPQLNPKYRVAVEKRVYMDSVLVGIPDTVVFEKTNNPPAAEPTLQQDIQTAVLSKPEIVSVPMSQEVSERYLEVREVDSGRVVTVVELLSPKNKQPGEGRRQYADKRQRLLATQTHLIEIDLLRAGTPMLVEGGRNADYQILVSRSNERPAAARYPFDLPEPIPCFPLPLSAEDTEPVIDLAVLLKQACSEAALDLAIDYGSAPVPALSPSAQSWLEMLKLQT
ncbi:MAG: DUF4058 family protein [Cyanobacteria bacterium P01_D01_bin.36]